MDYEKIYSEVSEEIIKDETLLDILDSFEDAVFVAKDIGRMTLYDEDIEKLDVLLKALREALEEVQ